jgi:hypothetical protein
MSNNISLLDDSSPPPSKRGQTQDQGGVRAGDQVEAGTTKLLFVAAMKSTGEFVNRIHAVTFVERMALATLLRTAISHLEAEAMTVVRSQNIQHQVSSIRRAA